MYSVPDSKRMPLPFKSVSLDGSIDLRGAKVTMKDGLWGVQAMRFREPVHPDGSIRSLTIDGHKVPLVSKDLRKGILSTRFFGDLEVIMHGPTESKCLATRAQIRNIRDWIGRQSGE